MTRFGIGVDTPRQFHRDHRLEAIGATLQFIERMLDGLARLLHLAGKEYPSTPAICQILSRRTRGGTFALSKLVQFEPLCNPCAIFIDGKSHGCAHGGVNLRGVAIANHGMVLGRAHCRPKEQLIIT